MEKLIQAFDLSQFDIGDLLWKIKKNGWYTAWGYNTFAEYVKTTGLKDSKSRYLPQISEVMEAVGFTRDQYQGVGIAKLRAIASLKLDDIYINPVTKEETAVKDYIKTLTEKAISDGDAFPLDEIKKYVRTLKGLVGERDIAFLGISTQRAILDSVMRPALERAKMLIGSVGKDDDGNSIDPSDAQAFAYICGDFLAAPVQGEPEPIEDAGADTDYIHVEDVGEMQLAQYTKYMEGQDPEAISGSNPFAEE